MLGFFRSFSVACVKNTREKKAFCVSVVATTPVHCSFRRRWIKHGNTFCLLRWVEIDSSLKVNSFIPIFYFKTWHKRTWKWKEASTEKHGKTLQSQVFTRSGWMRNKEEPLLHHQMHLASEHVFVFLPIFPLKSPFSQNVIRQHSKLIAKCYSIPLHQSHF